MKRQRQRLGISYLTILYLLLYFPIAVIVLFSFNNASHSLLWRGFTTRWYSVLFQDPDLAWATLHSLEIGILAASIATVLGALAAISLFRYRFFGRHLLSGLLFTLIIVPDLIIGLSLLLLFRFLSIPLGFWTLLLAHITYCIPFVFVTTQARLTQLDKHLVDAARDLGAHELTIFFRILLPLLWPGLLAGWLLSFTLSLDDVLISFFVSGPDYQILPLKIYGMVRLGVSLEINALCTLLLGLTLIIVILSQLLLRKRQ